MACEAPLQQPKDRLINPRSVMAWGFLLDMYIVWQDVVVLKKILILMFVE